MDFYKLWSNRCPNGFEFNTCLGAIKYIISQALDTDKKRTCYAIKNEHKKLLHYSTLLTLTMKFLTKFHARIQSNIGPNHANGVSFSTHSGKCVSFQIGFDN